MSTNLFFDRILLQLNGFFFFFWRHETWNRDHIKSSRKFGSRSWLLLASIFSSAIRSSYACSFCHFNCSLSLFSCFSLARCSSLSFRSSPRFNFRYSSFSARRSGNFSTRVLFSRLMMAFSRSRIRTLRTSFGLWNETWPVAMDPSFWRFDHGV